MWQATSREYFLIKWAQSLWEIEQARRIRRNVFCDEQGLFEDHDTDEIDLKAQVLVAIQQVAGMPERVVGTVRIYESAPGIWWGSRLAVEHEYRRQGVLGSGLIKLAVSSANTLGCNEFHAMIQAQNEILFRRLQWHKTCSLIIRGVQHVKMYADLDFYPALLHPEQGFWVEGRRHILNFESSVIEGNDSVTRQNVVGDNSWN